MAQLNEAYRVLSNPGRRAVYDAELSRRVTATPSTPRPTPAAPARAPLVRRPDDGAPAHYPWKLVVGMAAVGAGVVLLGATLIGPGSSPPTPDNILRPGECVTIEANGDAREVSCSGAAGELVVHDIVSFDDVCPPDQSAYRDRQGMGWACVTRRP